MKKSWLRGVLLGVSLALLLAGGVGLAQGLSLTADKECVECWPGGEEPTEDRHLLELTLAGWNPLLPLCERAEIDGVTLYSFCGVQLPEDPFTGVMLFPCTFRPLEGPSSLLGLDVELRPPLIDPLGEWVVRIWQENPPGTVVDSARVTFLVAEVCEVGFVPEPGTLLLLGSGLAGLVGYTALRWRARE